MTVETMALNLSTPGVYVQEVNAFPNSVVPVATALPAFIGYTARADYKGKSYKNKPVLINSLSDYLTFFGAMGPGNGGAPPAPLPPSGQYWPRYVLVPAGSKDEPDLQLGGKDYVLRPDPSTVFYLYNSIRLFFLNGGASAYVCSVGFMPAPPASPKPLQSGAPLVNLNVSVGDLETGLEAVKKLSDPTMLVVPDATLLSQDDNAQLMQEMLAQAAYTQSRVAILDVPGGLAPDPELWQNDITQFRTSVGTNGVDYGLAYYPFLETSVSSVGHVTYDNLGGVKALSSVLSDAQQPSVAAVLGNIQKPPPAPNTPTPKQSNQALLIASTDYAALYTVLLEKVNLLPPCGAIAGVLTAVDNARGVWKAPANVSIDAAVKPTLHITDDSQASLNVDAVSGKSVNAIRLFTGKGVLVWGARTLDGNSEDWRYVNVRRTAIMIEQSLRLASAAYVFEPNDANTWTTVAAMFENFLSDLWKQGALAGSKPSDAFQVAVGLGKTMTAEDIANGIMRIAVNVAITHPAEFIVITFSQMMQKS